jgi:hypothetical protein
MAGRNWTTKEEDEMFQELAENVDITQIALNHRRTEGAIRSRQRHLAAQLFQGGKLDIGKIGEKCRMNKKQVVRALERRGLTPYTTREAATQTQEDA